MDALTKKALDKKTKKIQVAAKATKKSEGKAKEIHKMRPRKHKIQNVQLY